MATENISKVLKPAEVSIKTLDGTVIKGKVNLAHENRMSDLLQKRRTLSLLSSMQIFSDHPRKKYLSLINNTSCGLNQLPVRLSTSRSTSVYFG
jgi:hypothetical protein